MKVSKNLFYLLISLAVIYICIVIWKRYIRGGVAPDIEGFTQESAYSLKRDDEIYDDFYSEIYDNIFSTPSRVSFEVQNIINNTQPSKRYSLILDVGCGTGSTIREFMKRGYKAVGIDKSYSMYKSSCNACGGGFAPASGEIIKYGNVIEPMTYEHNTFSHITCLYMTIYHIQDKYTFFRNCHSWLMQNGYFILHLVDFNKIISKSKSKSKLKPSYEGNLSFPKIPSFPYETFKEYFMDTSNNTPLPDITSINQKIQTNLIETPNELIPTEFKGVKYNNNFFTGDTNINNIGEFLWKETFEDIHTGHIRKNEITLYSDEHLGFPKFYNGGHMEEFMISPIIDIILKSGFILQGCIDMNYLGEMYNDNYLYFFEKLN